MAAQQVLLPCSLLVKTKPGRGLPKCPSLAGAKCQGPGGKTQVPVVIGKCIVEVVADGRFSDQYITTLTLCMENLMAQEFLWIHRSDI